MTFSSSHFDEVGDVLCLHAARGTLAVDFDETPEEHLLRFDREGRLLSLTILNVRWRLDRDGAVFVTLHAGGPTTRLPREVVEPLLVETPRY